MVRKRVQTVIKNYLPSATLLLLFFVIWEAAVWLWAIPRWILPAPTRIFGLIGSEYELLLAHTLITLEEVLVGFALAFITGLHLALLIFHFITVERAVYPLVIASQTIPVLAIAPLLIVWFGYGLTPKVIVVALIVFFPIVVNTVDGLKSVDPDAVNLLKILRANAWQILLKVRIPAALPFVFSGTKIGVSVSVIGAVIGEWVGAKAGLGYLMIHANAQLRIDLIFAAIFALSVLGVGLFMLVSLLERLIIPWRTVAR
ncbi:Riboflavin transport system permease protein RibX [Candidatus Entotheonellaceae bacterium PAL068K]